MSGILSLLVRGGAAAGFSPTSTESANFLTRATGITSTTDKTRYDALITGLVTDGVFAQLDILYIFAAPDRATAVLNLIQNAYNATENGTFNFSANVGYTGNGTDFWLDTNFNPFSASPTPQYQVNSASIGCYELSDNTGSTGVDLYTIASDNVGASELVTYYYGNTLWNIHSGISSTAATTSKGHWTVSRTSATGCALYNNASGTPIGTDVVAASGFVPRSTLAMWTANGASAPSTFSTAQITAGFFGGGLSSSDHVNLAARINTFMTAYGINVY